MEIPVRMGASRRHDSAPSLNLYTSCPSTLDGRTNQHRYRKRHLSILRNKPEAIAEKLQKGRKLSDVETLTLLTTERFNSLEREMRSGQKSLENRFESVDSELKAIRDRLGAIDTRLSTVNDIAQLKAEVAQLKARA